MAAWVWGSYGCKGDTCHVVAHAARHGEHLPCDMSNARAAALTWELRRPRLPPKAPENQGGRWIPASVQGLELEPRGRIYPPHAHLRRVGRVSAQPNTSILN